MIFSKAAGGVALLALTALASSCARTAAPRVSEVGQAPVPPSPAPSGMAGTRAPSGPPALVTLDLGAEAAAPGDVLTVRGCVPPIRPERPADIYLVFRSPRGRFYSVRHDGKVLRGIRPYMRGVTDLPDGWCGVLKEHVACADAPPGEYAAALVVMPAGTRPGLKRARAYAVKKITIKWP